MYANDAKGTIVAGFIPSPSRKDQHSSIKNKVSKKFFDSFPIFLSGLTPHKKKKD